MMIPQRGAPRLVTAVLLTAAVVGSVVVPTSVAIAAPGPTPAPVAAAALAGASAREASGLQLGVTIASDGLGRFSDDDRPGGDSGPANGIVRTSDAVVWAVVLAATTGAASDVVVTMVAPAGLSWSRLLDECSAEGSAVRGDTLTCAVGTLASGVRTVHVAATVDTALRHGTSLQPLASATADGELIVSAEVPAVTVSAVPRFDLSMNRSIPSFTPAVGPDGTTPGYRIVYPLQVHWEGLVGGGGLLGYERLDGPLTLVDDVSGMYGGAPSPAVLVPVDGAPACGVNTGQIRSAPGGAGGGENAVVDSGTISCAQDAPGEPVVITIDGVDTSLASIPTRSVSGGELPGGVVPAVVSAYVSLWVPAPQPGASLTAVNTYRDFAATSVSGRANYDGAGEPTHDNSVSRNLLENGGLVGSIRYRGWDTATSTPFALSGKHDDPYVTPAQPLVTSTSLNNLGRTPWSGTVVCTLFDTSQHTLREETPGSWAESNRPDLAGAPQFAAFDASDPAAARAATCGDDDLEWHADPRDVPGGPEAVGAVRWSYDHPGNTGILFTAHVTAESRLEDRTRMRAFASIRQDATSDWAHDTADPGDANGPWADFLEVTGNLARIRSAVVDPGHGPGDTPDETTWVTAGGQVTYALYPTLTNASSDRLVEILVVRDVLPEGAEYVPGSASREPEVDQVVVDGTTRQRLTWTIDPAVVDDPIDPITFDARFVSATAGAEAVNSATVEASRDFSDEARRTTERALRVLVGRGFDADETVDQPVHVVGDEVSFTLSYRNIGSETLPGSSLISVLPHEADDRGTTAGARPTIARPVAPAAREVVRYTSAPATEVSDDPSDTSNGPSGSTTWCTEAEIGAAPCPASLAAATAVRVDRADDVAPGDRVDHLLVLTAAAGGRGGEEWVSTFGLRAVGIDVTTTSPPARTASVAGEVTGLVWTDADHDGVRADDEPVREGHPVRLVGVDDRGAEVLAEGTTVADGSYEFDALRPGSYEIDFGGLEEGWTTQSAGDDRARDSDVDSDGAARVDLARVLDAGGQLIDIEAAPHIDAGARPQLVSPPVVDPPVVDPPVVEPPVVEPPVVGPGDATLTGAAQKLAFTGGDALTALAAALVLTGIGAALARRHRGSLAGALRRRTPAGDLTPGD
jgi:uncharacterized repeat protein (TIGR01451 family)